MPRPKRTKVASTRVAQSQAPTAVATRRNPPRHAPLEPVQISGDGDGLVIAATRPRRRNPWDLPEEPDVDYTMTGGLGEGDVAGAHKLMPDPYEAKSAAEAKAKRAAKKVTPEKKHANAIEALKKKRNEAAEAKAKKARKDPFPEVVVHSRRSSGGQATELSSENNEEPTSAQKPAPSPTPSPSPAKGAYPASALKAQGTPAMETSMMALTNFKRRSRQPSILRMVQQPSSDNNDSDVDLNFLDDFNPDDESTPVHVHKRTGGEEAGQESTLRSTSTGQSSGSKKRKAPSPEVQVLASSPPAPSSPPADFPQSSPLSRLATPSEHILETQENQPSVSLPQAPEEVWSSTMAPPLSSSPEPSSPSKQPEERHSKRRKTNEFDDLYDVTPRASDDEAEVAPSAKPKIPVKAKKPTRAPTLSTAKLQALLPRRRQRPRRAAEKEDEFDIPSSDSLDTHMLDSDQDELSIVAPRRRVTKTPARGQPAKAAKSLAQLSAKKKPAETKAKRGRPRKDVKTAGVTTAAAAPTRTYGRRHSDKENENEDSVWVAGETEDELNQEGETTIEEVLMSRELREQAEKFRKIDEVSLEFESVDHGSSSPWR
ncbi:uncharacterized protein BDZ99DRAFT_107285 [Mytilinidion resinicola]|uniref:Uncharacterized protein n=1 Tax=Mytilinidion resinicola TaxID=574789 RepID=A0A6A6YC19_9PEZI|nr:uncharacterized protein BDZ99DRAFT_107285 [Mytilinidion resinicola]KAF2805564.1 hypothetical protein BDZ99DRAFT_107285 [Mytilinidion resinicola]